MSELVNWNEPWWNIHWNITKTIADYWNRWEKTKFTESCFYKRWNITYSNSDTKDDTWTIRLSNKTIRFEWKTEFKISYKDIKEIYVPHVTKTRYMRITKKNQEVYELTFWWLWVFEFPAQLYATIWMNDKNHKWIDITSDDVTVYRIMDTEDNRPWINFKPIINLWEVQVDIAQKNNKKQEPQGKNEKVWCSKLGKLFLISFVICLVIIIISLL